MSQTTTTKTDTVTAPTTREELRLFIFNNSMLSMRGVGRLLAALDTFAVVCPREPTDAEANAALEIYDAAVGTSRRKAMGAALRYAYTASPFAPKEPTNG